MTDTLLKQFKKSLKKKKPKYKRFLSKLEKKQPPELDRRTAEADAEMWKYINCLECANCCKTMTPTYKGADIKRIALHLGISPKEMKEKWLKKDDEGDWINKSTPCQFLNPVDNKCSIYEVRPKDCAGFPHHTKKNMADYIHVYKQNIDYCPATLKMLEILKTRLS